MPEYDFHQLSPYDLEILVRDLFQVHWGVTIENFKTGKDGGIDLRYAAGSNNIIVQVKHFLKTGFSGLLREMGKEAAKVRRIGPSRYVVATSVPLSNSNKQAIVEEIGAELLNPNDIFGQEALNNLLGQYPEIEGKHYKLWLASRAVLDRVLHNATVTRSEFKARQVYETARRYVSSNAYPQALEMLTKHRVVVIAGPPGVGKTTLANLLLYEHLERGVQAILMQKDVEDGENGFQSGARQIFYFDDFMGATFLGDQSTALGCMNDSALLNFIAMIRATPTARLILTTREHIYSQAMNHSERLRHSDLDDFRVVLQMPSYSFAQRARILYNHLYFSDLPPEYQFELLRDEFYMRIINHQKFNPRLIEWLSNFRRIRTLPANRYRAFVEDLLRDPSEIWRHAYEQEATNAGRSLLLAIFSLGGRASAQLLEPAFSALHQERAKRYGFQTRPEDYRLALREAAGAFIEPQGKCGVEVIDPSVLDLLNTVVRSAPDNAVDIMAGASSFTQIERLWSFAKGEKGAPIIAAIRRDDDRLARTTRYNVLKRRRTDLGNGSIVYIGPTFERRLAVVLELAGRLESPAFASLIAPLFARLEQEWITQCPEINDAIALLRALDGADLVSHDHRVQMSKSILSALLEEISTGCGSDELRELVSVVDTEDANNPAVVAARCGFEHYRQSMFDEELRDCRSSDQFDGLIDDLTLFEGQFGVDVAHLVQRAEEAKVEFEEYEWGRADAMEDELKERWSEERADKRDVSEMFGSLKGVRD